MPAEASARTLSVAPSVPVIENVRSPLDERDAALVIVPATRTRRPSVASPIAPASTTLGRWDRLRLRPR